MGKKKSGSHGHGAGEKVKEEKARVFVLKVDMHCSCQGCIDKIRAAAMDMTSNQGGIESWDQSALETKGELKLLATADPEKLRHRLHKATRKNVDLLFPKDKDNKDANNKAAGKDTAAAAAHALLNSLQAQQVHQQNAWGANPQLLLGLGAGGGWNAQAAYPSYAGPVVQQQHLDPYLVGGGYGGYPAGGAWGGAYPHQGAGYGGWYGHGY